MLVEVRTLPRKKGNYIRQLQHINRLPMHISENGYVAYDEDEFTQYRESVHRGRPIKQVDSDLRYHKSYVFFGEKGNVSNKQ